MVRRLKHAGHQVEGWGQEVIITHADLASCKFCNRGARQFFDRHGLNWSSFLQHGIDSSELEHIDDAMVRQVLDRAARREQEGK